MYPHPFYHRHTRFLLPVAHLPLLLPGLQAQRLAKGAHKVSARDQRGQLQLLALQLHLHLPLAAGEAHEPSQGHQGAGNARARRHRLCRSVSTQESCNCCRMWSTLDRIIPNKTLTITCSGNFKKSLKYRLKLLLCYIWCFTPINTEQRRRLSYFHETSGHILFCSLSSWFYVVVCLSVTFPSRQQD